MVTLIFIGGAAGWFTLGALVERYLERKQ